MKNNKVYKIIITILICIYVSILISKLMLDKGFYNEMMYIFNKYDYRAVNGVFLIYIFCSAYCFYKLIRFIVKKFKNREIINNEIN